MQDTTYNIEQIIQNEKGWVFYNTALKTWRELYCNIIGESVLDIGCAGGISMGMIKLFNPKIDVIGFEGNDSSQKIWEKRNLVVKTGDIYSLPFKDKSFDTVYSSNVLEHLQDPQKAIDESIRIAKKRIIHIVPEGNVNDKNYGSDHLRYFNRVNFQELFLNKNIKTILYKSIEDSHMNSLICVCDV